MRGKRQAGTTDAFDVCLRSLGTEPPSLRPEFLRTPLALANLLIHRPDEPLILLVQLRPRWRCHSEHCTGPQAGVTEPSAHPSPQQQRSPLRRASNERPRDLISDLIGHKWAQKLIWAGEQTFAEC